MKRKFLILTLLPLCFFTGCVYYGTYDVHSVHYQNNSSHNILIQYFLDRDYYTRWENYDGAGGNVYRFNVNEVKKTEKYEVGIGTSDYSPINKIWIVDTDTRKLLRTIEDGSFLLNLPATKHTEKKPDETVTYYEHQFIITDEFLNGE